MKKQLNIDRLHEIVSTINSNTGVRQRACGFTVAYIQLLIGEVELGDEKNVYLYVGENRAHAHDTQNQFLDIIRRTYTAQAITYSTDGCVIAANKTFFFVGLDKILQPCFFTGKRFSRVFFDVSSELQREHEEELTQAFLELQTRLVQNSGDIL